MQTQLEVAGQGGLCRLSLLSLRRRGQGPACGHAGGRQRRRTELGATCDGPIGDDPSGWRG